MKPQPREAVDELRERIAVRERLDMRDGVIQHIFRCLADAMVWKAARFDRALFAVLGDGVRVGRFPAEEGAAAERGRAQQIWDQGWGPIGADGEPLALWRLPTPYRHHLDSLAATLAAARRDGYAEAQPDPALVVSAVDLEWALAHRKEVGDWTTRAAEARSWPVRDDGYFATSALATRVRERRHAGSAYLALSGSSRFA